MHTPVHTPAGIPDMLNLLVDLTQRMLGERLSYVDELQCTVLEVKVCQEITQLPTRTHTTPQTRTTNTPLLGH